MILVFCLVLVFHWIYLRKFRNLVKLKIVLTVLAFGIFVSFLVSAVSVCSLYGMHNFDIYDLKDITTTMSQFSLPLHLRIEFIPTGKYQRPFPQPDFLFIRVFFAGARLSEMELTFMRTRNGGYICPSEYPYDVDYTVSVIFQLFLTFTAFNMIGIPLAAIIHKLMRTRHTFMNVLRHRNIT